MLVVGDSMLDRYWEGAVERISPEAPVPVLRLGREWQRPGGAANVAMNLSALGCDTVLATLVGDDPAGRSLTALVREGGVECVAVLHPGLPTTQKIRAVCRRQQLLRVDIEERVPEEAARALATRVDTLLPGHRWVLLSDYSKGALHDCTAMIRRAHAQGGRVLVDPKGDDFARYRGAWLVKPNQAEAERVVGRSDDDAGFDARMAALRGAIGAQHLLVTRGERGMVLYGEGRPPLRVPGLAREVYDVSGAGDTVLAALAAALAEGATVDDAVAAANRAAAVVVGKFGTATVTREELGAMEPAA
jgi:D-glycero-beta-D-manno-heptose-7-phosphate kinase